MTSRRFLRPISFASTAAGAATALLLIGCASPPHAAKPTGPAPSLSTSATDKRPGPTAPREADAFSEAAILSRVTVPAGAEVRLYAAPPLVRYPTSVAAAPTGEVYVAIDENGSLGNGRGRGRVVRCMDRDDDGHAEACTTFAQMDSPRGVIWDAGAIYVIHPPFVTAHRDTDGDGIADDTQVLVSGLGFDLSFRGADHTTNGGRLGLDGYIYVAVGDYGAIEAKGRDGATLALKGGGVVRVRTDGTGLEAVSRGQRNIYDVAIGPELDLFTRDNTNDGDGWNDRLSHVVALGQYGYPSLFKNFADEIVPPLADYGAGSPTGALYLDEAERPPGFGNGLYTVEWGRRAIFRHVLTPKGASFTAGEEKVVEIQRPTDMDADPFGRLFITSWEGAVFNYAGPKAGYLVRVSRPGAPRAVPLDLRKMSDADLVAGLRAPGAAARFGVQREIVRRGRRPETTAALRALLAEPAPRAARIAGLFALASIDDEAARDTLLGLARSGDVKALALQALANDPRRAADVPSSSFAEAARDADPRVRLQAVTALARLGRKDQAAVLLDRTADGDPLVAHVAEAALVELRAALAPLTALAGRDARLRASALRVLRRLHEPAVVNALAARARRETDPAFRRALLAALCRLHRRESAYDGKWWGTRPDTAGPYYKPERWEGTAAAEAPLRRALAGARGDEARFLVAELAHNRVAFDGLTDLLLTKAGSDTAMKLTAVEGLFGDDASLPARGVAVLREISQSPREAPALRARALSLYLRAFANASAFDAIADAFAPFAGGDVTEPAIAAVYQDYLRDPRHDRYVKRWASEAASASPRRALAQEVLVAFVAAPLGNKQAKAEASKVIDALSARPELQTAFLGAIGRTRARAFTPFVERALASADHGVAESAAFAAERIGAGGRGVAGAAGAARLLDGMAFDDVVAAVATAKGDAEQGRGLFQRQGCVACHTVGADEPSKGPFLGGIATRYSRRELSEAILKPSARIAQGFESQWVTTKAGEQLEGFVTRESGEEIELRSVAGVATVVKKKDVAARGKREESIMPEGLAANLTPAELAALLAYLESLPGH